MSRKRLKALTLDDIAAQLQEFDENSDSDDEIGEVVTVPPDVDALTDEDDIADDELGDFFVQDLSMKPMILRKHVKRVDAQFRLAENVYASSIIP